MAREDVTRARHRRSGKRAARKQRVSTQSTDAGGAAPQRQNREMASRDRQGENSESEAHSMTPTTRSEMQRLLASEFERHGWTYDLNVAPAILDEVERTGIVEPDRLASKV